MCRVPDEYDMCRVPDEYDMCHVPDLIIDCASIAIVGSKARSVSIALR